MGKYNLGVPEAKITGIDKDTLYLNDSVARSLSNDVENQLEIIRASLFNTSQLLNKLVNQQYIKGSRINIFKGWARKAKSQAIAAEKLKEMLNEKYLVDLKQYPINLLDEKIEKIEEIIRKASEE